MGGAEVFTHEVLKRWAQAGHEATLFTSEFHNSERNQVSDGVNIIRDGRKYSVYSKAKEYYDKLFSKEEYDVVIDEINTRPFMTPKFIKKGEKIIALIHQLAREYWFYETPFPINYLGYYFFEERWLKSYTKIPTVTVSESTREDLSSLGFEKIFVVGEGLNFQPLEKVAEKTSNPVVVFAGRLKKAKRPDKAIDAFKIVKQRVPEAELWIIGNGHLKNKLMKNSFGGVRFFDLASNEERRELIKKAWVLVNPSVREGFGLNIVEANALGVPSVAFAVAGLRDSIIDGETGLLVKSDDVGALAEALIQTLTTDDLRAKLTKRALAYSRGFSWDDVADKFMHILESA